jgi:WD40 repeat protein
MLQRPILNSLLEDASRFLTQFGEAIGDSALQVYDSALLFTPRNSTLFKTFHHEFESSVTMLSNRETIWNPSSRVAEHPTPMVDSGPMSKYLFALRNSIMGLQKSAIRLRNAIVNGDSMPINWVAVCPDGTRFLSSSQGTMYLWDTSTGHLVVSFEYSSTWIKFSPDSKRFVCWGENGVQLRDLATGMLITIIDSLVHFSPDGARIVSHSQGGWRLWDSTTGRLVAGFDDTSALRFSPDGARIVTESCNMLHLHDSRTAKYMAFLGYSGIQSVDFSLDSTRITSPGPRGIQLWDAVNGQLIALLGCKLKGHFSPDSSCFISGDELQMWDAVNGKPTVKQPFTTISIAKTRPERPTYHLRDKWVVGLFQDQLKWICWLPEAVRGNAPVVSSSGNWFALGNERGQWTLLDLSRIQWMSDHFAFHS